MRFLKCLSEMFPHKGRMVRLKAFDDFMKWSYIRYMSFATGGLGAILLLSCFGVISSAGSLSGGDMYSAFGGVTDLYNSFSNMSSMYTLNFFMLILFTIVIFLKMKTGGRMNYKAGYLFLGSLVTGLLCEGMIASIRNNVLNPYSFAMDAFASSIQTLGFLVLLMGCLQIAGAVLAYQEKEVLAQRTADGSSEEHTVHHAGDTEEEICALVDYLMDNKANIEFSLNEQALDLAKEMRLPEDFSKQDIRNSYEGLDFLKKRKVRSMYQKIRASQKEGPTI